jgi:hypothetical protein
MIRRWVCGLLLLASMVLLFGCGHGVEDKINLPQSGKALPPPKPPAGDDAPE